VAAPPSPRRGPPPPPAKKKYLNTKRWAIVWAIVISCVTFGLVTAAVNLAHHDPPGQTAAIDHSYDQQDAIDECQKSAKESLKDPDSARFDSWKATEALTPPPAGWSYNALAGDRYYLVSGMVNAKNGFGGYTGDELYTCDAVVSRDKVDAQARPVDLSTPSDSSTP
jgi:hypothetical protein